MRQQRGEDGNGARSKPGGIGRRLLVALAVALVVQALFVVSYVGALHSPKAHSLPFGVVGSSDLPAAVGRQLSLEVTTYATPTDALHAIDVRKIDGALVTGRSGGRLFVVPAGGPAAATALSSAFGAAAAASKQPIQVVTVHPLPKGDAGGGVSFLVSMALVVGGYLTATMAMAFGGPATRRGRLAALATVAIVGALVTDTIAGPILGAVPSSKFVALWALFSLIMAAVAFATGALQTVLGPAGTLVVIVVFVIFGAPAAGGTVPSPFLPTFWATLGPWLPAGAATTAVRNLIYFDGNAIAKSLLVLTAYLVVGAIVVVSMRARFNTSSSEGEAEAAAGAATTIV